MRKHSRAAMPLGAGRNGLGPPAAAREDTELASVPSQHRLGLQRVRTKRARIVSTCGRILTSFQSRYCAAHTGSSGPGAGQDQRGPQNASPVDPGVATGVDTQQAANGAEARTRGAAAAAAAASPAPSWSQPPAAGVWVHARCAQRRHLWDRTPSPGGSIISSGPCPLAE